VTDTDFDGLPGLNGTVTSVAVIDHDGNPNKVIDDDQPFDVRVTWNVTPAVTAKLLDGTWTVRAYAESMGPGPEKLIGTANVAANGGTNYAATMSVPVSTLPSDVAPDSGVYKLVVVITYRNRFGQLTEIAAFAEGSMFLLREP